MDIPKKGDWLSRHAVAGIVFLLLIFMIIAAGVYLWYVAQPVCCQNPVLENEQIHENAAWKTYSNTKFGYEMKYPADWTAKTTEIDEGSYVTLTSPDKRLNVTINYSGTYDDGVYRNATEDEKALINKILSTFKFIDRSDTSSWKTYRSDEYGFEFKYPQTMDLDEIPENLGLLKEINISNGLGLFVSVATDQSISKGVMDCGGAPECFSYVKSCGTDKCSTYSYSLFSGYYYKHKVFLKNQLIVDFSQTFNVPNFYSGELDENRFSDFMVSGRIEKGDQEVLKIFEEIISTFKFIK